jgi:hypothetical protein
LFANLLHLLATSAGMAEALFVVHTSERQIKAKRVAPNLDLIGMIALPLDGQSRQLCTAKSII